MIDIHSHVIPGIDDGSRSIEMTLEMLKRAEMDGTKTIVATPHFCRGYGEEEYPSVKEKVKDLNIKAKEAGININILYGQEVYYSQDILNDYKEGLIGTIEGTNYMLFELPMRDKFDESIFDLLYELQILGVKLILAHPERYKFLKEDPSLINRFIDEDILFQMNAGSICGEFGKDVKKTAEVLLKNGIYNFIGSDAHNNKNRVTGISEGIKEASKINPIYPTHFTMSSEVMLDNDDVEFIGRKITKKSFLQRIFGK